MSIMNDKEYLELIVKRNINIKQCFVDMKMAGSQNYKTFHKYIKKYNIDISHFETRSETIKRTKPHKVHLLQDLLILNSNVGSCNLKKKLYLVGLKSEICEICGLDNFWNGMKINLQLDHINGNSRDNRIENLRILCPNCHSQTKTYCSSKTKTINQQKKAKKKLLKEEQNQIKLNIKINKILEANLDFETKSWGVKVAEILECSPQYALKFVKQNILKHQCRFKRN